MVGVLDSLVPTRDTRSSTKVICADEPLALLDRELAEVWRRAFPNFPGSELPTVRAIQRGWIAGRNDCWKAEDVAACVRTSYERRITELQVKAGLVQVPESVRFDCDSGGVLWVTFFANTKLPVAVLTSDGEQVFAFGEPVASGTRYAGPDVVYREHQGEVHLEWQGTATTCRPAPGSAHASPCDGAPPDATFVIATSPPAGAVLGAPSPRGGRAADHGRGVPLPRTHGSTPGARGSTSPTRRRRRHRRRPVTTRAV